MSTTITYPGGTPIVPTLAVLGSANVEVESRTITHEILDGPPVHTLRRTRPQTGELELLFVSSSAAHAAKDQLIAADVYTVTSTDDAALNLRIIIRSVVVEQSTEIATMWSVRVAYEAVL